MRAMDPHDRAAGAVLVGGFDGHALPSEVASRLADGRLAGVILFRRNLVDARQARALNADVLAAHAHPALVALDQEGGRVTRLRDPVISLPTARALGAIDDVALTRALHRALGEELAALGFNFDLAPVCDVDSNPANPVIGDRSFGRDAALVSRHAAAAVEGLREGGVLACAKHFPGHGGTREDSHRVLPSVAATVESLRRVELVPFAAVAESVAAVMVAHVVYEGVDRELPASLSPRCATELLREVVGARGAAITDDLEMTPIRTTWGVADAAVRAIAAGNDLATIAHSPAQAELARQAIASRAAADEAFRARLTAAAARVDALRARIVPPTDPGPVEPVAALLAEVRARGPRHAPSYRDPTTR